MEKVNKICQCCGMPMKQDPEKGGTNADGTISQKYCSYCYIDGDFTFKGTVSELQEFCKNKLIENGNSKFTAWLFTRGMKRLERWKQEAKNQ